MIDTYHFLAEIGIPGQPVTPDDFNLAHRWTKFVRRAVSAWKARHLHDISPCVPLKVEIAFHGAIGEPISKLLIPVMAGIRQGLDVRYEQLRPVMGMHAMQGVYPWRGVVIVLHEPIDPVVEVMIEHSIASGLDRIGLSA